MWFQEKAMCDKGSLYAEILLRFFFRLIPAVNFKLEKEKTSNVSYGRLFFLSFNLKGFTSGRLDRSDLPFETTELNRIIWT